MIKLEEFCCGCTLRTGTLIILWITLVFDGIRSLFYFAKILYDPSYLYERDDKLSLLTIFLDALFLTSCTFGMAIATFGIYAIQKNKPDFLTPGYYYYFGYVGYWLLIVFTVLVRPSAVYYVSVFSPLHFLGAMSYYAVAQYSFMFALGYFFMAALTFYMTLIIKNCKENMINNGTGGFDREMPDPTTLGYSPEF